MLFGQNQDISSYEGTVLQALVIHRSKSAHISYTCYLCYLQVESNLCILDSILDICESRCLVMCNNLYTKFHLIYPWHQRRHHKLCEMGILFCSRQSQYCVCIFLSDNRLVDNFLKPSVVCSSTSTARALCRSL